MSKNYRNNFNEDKRGNYGWYTCAGCGKKMRRSECTVDHIVPQSWGGWHSGDNLQPMCQSCNSRKRDSIRNTMPDYMKNNADRAISKMKRSLKLR